MTVAQGRTNTLSAPRSIALGTLFALLFGTSLVGGLVGGTVAARLVPSSQAAAQVSAATPAPTFDAVKFREEERQPLNP